jgi:hypothetical protein
LFENTTLPAIFAKFRVTIEMINQCMQRYSVPKLGNRHKTRVIIQLPVIVVLPNLRVQQVLHLNPRRRAAAEQQSLNQSRNCKKVKKNETTSFVN